MAGGKPGPRSKAEIEAAISKLAGEYDHFCGVTITGRNPDAVPRTVTAAELVTVTQYRSKLKALYWALGQGEL